MNIGVGLPTSTPGINAELLLDWAKRADAGPFSSLAVVDRVAYQNYEPFIALAAAAAVTRRVRLATMVVIGPLRNTAILAKQAASLDALSGGRFTLGLAVGARGEDYQASGIDSRGRGRGFGEELEAIREVWEDGMLGATPRAPGPQMLVVGSSGEALARMARYADGYMHGGGPPRAFAGAASKALTAWSDLGRPGRARLWGVGYVAPARRRGARPRRAPSPVPLPRPLPPGPTWAGPAGRVFGGWATSRWAMGPLTQAPTTSGTTTPSRGRSPRRSRPETSPRLARSRISFVATKTRAAMSWCCSRRSRASSSSSDSLRWSAKRCATPSSAADLRDSTSPCWRGRPTRVTRSWSWSGIRRMRPSGGASSFRRRRSARYEMPITTATPRSARASRAGMRSTSITRTRRSAPEATYSPGSRARCCSISSSAGAERSGCGSRSWRW